MSTKPGNFGGFHLVNIDDTIEISSEKLIKDTNNNELKFKLATDDEYGSKVNLYLINEIDTILFEILTKPKFGMDSEVHYHIIPESFDLVKSVYSDVVELRDGDAVMR